MFLPTMSSDSRITVPPLGVALWLALWLEDSLEVCDWVGLIVFDGATKLLTIAIKIATELSTKRPMTKSHGQTTCFELVAGISAVRTGRTVVLELSRFGISRVAASPETPRLPPIRASARWAKTKAFAGRSSGFFAKQFITSAATSASTAARRAILPCSTGWPANSSTPQILPTAGGSRPCTS